MGVKRFVHLSTAGVHAGVRGVVSECSPIKPRTPYEKSKAEAEKIVNTYTNKLDITILRPALLIGPNPYWANIFRLVKRRFPIIGDGNNRMQLLYVEDLASAIVLCLEKEESIGQTYIIASEERISLENLYKTIQSVLGIKNDPKRIAVWQAKLLAKMLAVKAKITRTRTIITQEHIERLVRDRLYDTTKISALGWYAKHTIREALKRSAEELKRMGKL
jgi:UDP-glucose 4-epimerase